MSKKNQTLPAGFQELLEHNRLEEIQAVYQRCDINARERGGSKNPALAMYAVTPEVIAWLVGQGADINAQNGYGRSALHVHAGAYEADNLQQLLALGADVHLRDHYGNTALHHAAQRSANVRALLAHGADALAHNHDGETPLAHALAQCSNSTLAEVADAAELLLQAGDAVSPAMQQQVARLGENFEFHRKHFDPEELPAAEAGLHKLYGLFGVTPAAGRTLHDGVSPIRVPAGSTQEQMEALWALLVPGSGKADTVQGELVRIAGKVRDEILRNGGCNWDSHFENMLAAIPGYLKAGKHSAAELAEAERLICVLTDDDADEAALDALVALAVAWVSNNPQPVALGEVAYRR